MDLVAYDAFDTKVVPEGPDLTSVPDSETYRHNLRQEPYECNSSRTDLCGGPPERAVPTATQLARRFMRSCGASPRSESRFKPEPIADTLQSPLATEWAAAPRRLTKSIQFFVGLTLVHAPDPIPRPLYRPRRKRRRFGLDLRIQTKPQARIRIRTTPIVWAMTRSKAMKSSSSSKIVARALARLRTWKTTPPGAIRAVRGMAEV